MFPDPNRSPSGGLELAVSVCISLTVPLDLGAPPIGVSPRPGPMVRASVPEAAINKDRHSGFRKNEVSLSAEARKRLSMYEVPETLSMEAGAQGEFALGVSPALCRHPSANCSCGRFRHHHLHFARLSYSFTSQPDINDPALEKVLAWFLGSPNVVERFGAAIRQSLDEVYDGQRTGRFDIGQLTKVEKTYIGTKVEIVIQDEFALERGGSHGMDYRIAGIQVDCKWSMSMGKWMIPKEAVGQLCLVVWANDLTSVFSVGLVRATNDVLKTGKNQDGKRYLNAQGLEAIVWLADRSQLPENLLLHISDDDRDAIFSLRSGQSRVDELFRRIQRRIIRREVVLAVARQLDSPKRVRDARLHLAPEGIRILGHEFSDRAEAIKRKLPIPGKGQWVSYQADRVINDR